MKNLGALPLKRILVIALSAIVFLSLVLAPIATRADAKFDLTHRYTPPELADMSKSDLIQLVMSLQGSPRKFCRRRFTPRQ